MAVAVRGGDRLRTYLRLLVGVTVVLVVANWPVTTLQGVNFEVTSHRLPLYVKSFQFLDRHAQYRQIATEVTAGKASDTERVSAIFDFTRRSLHQTPDGWTTVDDHILNILIRGYGQNDQFADVYTLLCTYAGVPAFWQKVRAPGTDAGVIFSFAKVDGRWTVADPHGGFLFRNRHGQLATAEEVATQPDARPAAIADLLVKSVPYGHILDALRTPPIPRTLRAELQMPWPRLWYETQRAFGREDNDGSER